MKKSLITWLLSSIALLSACNSVHSPVLDKYTIPSTVYSISLDSDEEIKFDSKSPCRIVSNCDTFSGRTHFRGGYSSRFSKHSYAIKLDKKQTIAGQPEDKDFILNASFVDKTFIRHKLSFDLFRMMSPINKAPICTYSELYANGQYNGLYVVMQKMDASTLGVVKTDSSTVIFKEPPIFYETKIIAQDSSNYYQQTFPKKKKQDRTYQADALHSFIFGADDSTFKSNVSRLFDLNNIADWHILLLLTNNSDGVLKNFFLYKCNDSIPYRIAVWDYDHSFGRDGDGEYNMLSRNVDINRNQLIKRLMCMPEYRHLIARRWNELRGDGIISSESIIRIINANASVVREAAIRDSETWPINDIVFFDETDFDKELNIIREFVILNVQRLDNYFADIAAVNY